MPMPDEHLIALSPDGRTRHLSPSGARLEVRRRLSRKFVDEPDLACAFVQAVAGVREVEALSVRECADVLHLLDTFASAQLRVLARRGAMPSALLHVELRLRVRGDTAPGHCGELARRIAAALRSGAVVPPGLTVDAVVVAVDPAAGATAGQP